MDKKGNEEIYISNSEKVKEYAKRFSQEHWTFLGPGDEKKWYGTPPYTPEGNWDSTATQMVERFKDTGHPVFKSISALSRGILKKGEWQGPHTLQNDASNTELLFRFIHSVNHLTIYGAKSQEGKLLVSSPRPVSGNSLQEHIQDFESLSHTIRFTRVGELASFQHRVSAGMSYKTRPHEDDSFGQIIS